MDVFEGKLEGIRKVTETRVDKDKAKAEEEQMCSLTQGKQKGGFRERMMPLLSLMSSVLSLVEIYVDKRPSK